MIEKNEISVITRAVGRVMREYVSTAIVAVTKLFREELDARFKAIPPGERGEPGIRGEKGDRGEQGIQGIAGPAGERGIEGQTGPRGEAGASVKGERGEIGPVGPKGEPGVSIKGDAGERGPNGEPGASIKGDTGERGLPGPKGDAGESIKGEQGERGADGKSPEVEPIIAAVLQRIPTPKDGARGAQGPAGESIKGDKGDKGEPGQSIRGEVGPLGPRGETGQRGEPGQSIKGDPGERGFPGESIRGEKGEQGEPGRPPTPEELEKCVEREFSKFALGCERRIQELADRAFQRAIDKMPLPKDGIDGKDGRDALDLEDMDLTLDDDGFIHFTFKRGQIEKSFTKHLPTVSDKGVYKSDKKYLRQNGVTHNGCFWIAQIDNPSEAPGVGTQWRMAVKAGRNGKDGAKGDQGPQGTPGQDLRYK